MSNCSKCGRTIGGAGGPQATCNDCGQSGLTYDEVYQQVRTDVDYALRQLRGLLERASHPLVVDHAQRAIDALERVQSRLIAEPPDSADDDEEATPVFPICDYCEEEMYDDSQTIIGPDCAVFCSADCHDNHYSENGIDHEA